MAFRFTCTACRTVMKVQDGFIEPKKVRCTGCGIVVMLTPDPDDPEEITVSYPKKTRKRNEMSDAKKRVLLFSILGVLLLSIGGGLWWTLRGPSDRAAVTGDVNYEGVPMENGMISFIQTGDGTTVTAEIKKGRYVFRASKGPRLGANRVEILGNEKEPVGPAYSGEESKLSADIQPGANTHNFDVGRR